ncbi:MAG TPA: hypothetical protein VJ028_00070, partial [Patescibacteria group bacterium]|nr:hypothetical protein [Patescibacteria group bacterium]
VKNAFFDVSGISAVHSGQTLHLSLDDDNTDDAFDFDESTAKTYTLDSTGGPTPFHLIYNVTNVMATSGKDCYVNSRGAYDCTLSFRADNASIYGLTINLVLTYQFTKAASGVSDETRTTTTFIHQDSAVRPSGQQANENFDFTFVMTDEIVDVKNAFFDVSGISAVHSGQTLHLSLDDDNTDDAFDFDESTAKTYTLDSTGGPTPFHLIYNVTNVMATSGKDCYVNSRGAYDCTLSFRSDNVSIYALSIKLTATYRFKPPSGGGGNIPASGTYISPVYDSKVASDDAGGTVSKSGFNTIKWIEDVSNGTLVKSLTIAANNDNATWNYYGGDGTSNESACEGSGTCYARSNVTYCSSTSLGSNRYEILCRIAPQQQNFRYFRFKAKLCNEKTSPSQCNGGNGNNSSKIEKVILNWSP